jgi:hypothetical protein
MGETAAREKPRLTPLTAACLDIDAEGEARVELG